MSAPALERPTTPESVFTGLPAELIAALAAQGSSPDAGPGRRHPRRTRGPRRLGRAQTGSGKTLAFGIPVLARLAGERSRPGHPRAVMVVPTYELALPWLSRSPRWPVR